MDIPATTRIYAPVLRPLRLLRVSRLALAMSLSLLALAPLSLEGGYSFVSNTLSESGGQGVAGAWVHRLGVLFAAGAVLIMIAMARRTWSAATRILLRVYAAALVGLAVFPESAWDGRPFDATVARLHTISGVIGAVAFIFAAITVSVTRPPDNLAGRAFDWTVAIAVAVIPELMLVTDAEGALQRLMVALGYVWLFAESQRIGENLRTAP